jgi:hypothetical protein
MPKLTKMNLRNLHISPYTHIYTLYKEPSWWIGNPKCDVIPSVVHFLLLYTGWYDSIKPLDAMIGFVTSWNVIPYDSREMSLNSQVGFDLAMQRSLYTQSTQYPWSGITTNIW